MKTNPSARGLRKIRLVMLWAALAAIAGLEIYGGASLAARTGQTTARQTDSPSAPNVSISDLIAAAR
jgi:hypothetical protein